MFNTLFVYIQCIFVRRKQIKRHNICRTSISDPITVAVSTAEQDRYNTYCVLFKVYIIQTRCGRVYRGGRNADDKEGPRGHGKLGRKIVGTFVIVNRHCVGIPSIHSFSFSFFLFLSRTRQKSSTVFCLPIFYPYCMFSV